MTETKATEPKPVAEIARMKLVQENIRAIANWIVGENAIQSHHFSMIDNMMEITIDMGGETHIILEGQWLIKDKNGKFRVSDK